MNARSLSRTPKRDSAQKTFNRIVDTAGLLLAEVGVERVTTNVIAERAGVTPPTIYHYFPDKYAIFRELGERLMTAQNSLVQLSPDQSVSSIAATLRAHVDLTRSFPGGVWITRMLRAIPELDSIRTSSHNHVATLITDAICLVDQTLDRSHIFVRSRLAVELGYAAIELALEDPALDTQDMLQTAAHAVAACLVPAIAHQPEH